MKPREVLRRIMDFHLGIAEHYAELGVEIVSLSDDLGTQQGLLLSPQIIDEFLMPEYRRLIGFYKRRGVTVNFHSCGHVEPLIGRFLERGIDILNPIRPPRTTWTRFAERRRAGSPCRAATAAFSAVPTRACRGPGNICARSKTPSPSSARTH